MKWDNLFKECIIIGAISLVFSLLFVTIEAEQLIRIFQTDCTEGIIGVILKTVPFPIAEYRSRFLKDHSLKLVAFVAAALVSSLLMFGIRKRRAVLMVPWLLAGFGGAAFSVYTVLLNLIFLPFARLELLAYGIAIIGLESTVLYSVCTLFTEIRQEKSKKLRCLAVDKPL